VTPEVAALEAIGSARAMRYLCPDPIPDEAVEQLIWAATRASSAHNSQPWEFVVLRDERVRAEFGELIRAAAQASDPLPPHPATRSDQLIDAGVRNLFGTLGHAPAIILVCGADVYPPSAPDRRFLYSAIYSAAQNVLVAARALGLGAAFTMLHTLAEPAIRELLGIPDEITIGVTMPVGRPARPFRPIVRKPVAEVTHLDRWLARRLERLGVVRGAVQRRACREKVPQERPVASQIARLEHQPARPPVDGQARPAHERAETRGFETLDLLGQIVHPVPDVMQDPGLRGRQRRTGNGLPHLDGERPSGREGEPAHDGVFRPGLVGHRGRALVDRAPGYRERRPHLAHGVAEVGNSQPDVPEVSHGHSPCCCPTLAVT
jgi:nitroreductase